MSEEFPVAQSYAVGTVGSHHVLVILTYFNYDASLVPFERVATHLVLDANMVPNFERRETPSVF